MTKALKERYLRARDLGIQIIDMDIPSLAGYYLYNYAADPIGALLSDVADLKVPETVGMPARILIMSTLQRDMYVK